MSKAVEKKEKIQKESYIEGLGAVEKARYLEKLKLFGGTDPYDISVKSFSDDKKLLPAVTYPDIVNYLLFSPSPYTKDDLKALKSLDAYNQALNGWVSDVKASVIGGLHVIRSKVLHSMKLREKPLQPWSIVEPDGVIRASHCTCMAGLGEVCTHIAAMFFTVMEIVRTRDTQTVTQDPAYWKFPASVKSVEYKAVKDIDFTSAKSLKRKFDAVLSCDSPKPSSPSQTPVVKKVSPPTNDDISEFFKNLHATGKKAAILSVVETYCEDYKPAIEKLKMPTILTDLKHKDALNMNYSQLLKQIEGFDLHVSDEEVDNVETVTREQSNNKLWYTFRAGRITAFNMKRVCSTDPAHPSHSLIMSVWYPDCKKFTNEAIQWGKRNEKVTVKKLEKALVQRGHKNVLIQDCGLFICKDKPYIAASPDGIVSCDCCGQQLLEIKCNMRKSKNR